MYPEIRKELKARVHIKPHDIVKIRKLHREGFKPSEISIAYGVTVQKIVSIIRRK